MTEYLTCSKCKLATPEVSFYPSRTMKRGWLYWCITCLKDYKQQPEARAGDLVRAARRTTRRRLAKLHAVT